MSIENGAHDALNAGLGLFKEIETQIGNLKGQFDQVVSDLQSNGPQSLVTAAEEQFTKLRTQIEASYEELVARGAADQSEQVVQLRGLIDQGLGAVKDVQTKIEGALGQA